VTGRQGIGIGAGVGQEPDDLWAVGEVTGPISDNMQERPGAAAPTDKSGRRQRGIIPQQSPDRLDVTYTNRQTQLNRDLVAVRDPLAGLPLAHGGP
jgi:hypothetical protein